MKGGPIIILKSAGGGEVGRWGWNGWWEGLWIVLKSAVADLGTGLMLGWFVLDACCLGWFVLDACCLGWFVPEEVFS